MKIDEILIKPILTEKATKLAASGIYMFEVAKKANKNNVKEALQKLYSVKIDGIKVANKKGKVKKVGKKMTLKKLPGKKIAYVKVKSGKIDLFPQA